MNTLEAVFRLVLDTSWRMACLILVVLTLRALLRGHVSARVLFWIWIALAVRLLVPVAVPAKWSPFNLIRMTERTSPTLPSALPSAESDLAGPASARLTPSESVSLLKAWSARLTALSPVQSAAIVWALGVAVLMLNRIRAHHRLAHRLRRLAASAGSAPTADVAEARSRPGMRGVQVFVTDLVGAPALIGILRPKLLFPPGLLVKLSPRELELIVAHELGHHQRRDLLAQALLQAARILHWFNPLVWVATRTARHDCELACDEHVVRGLGEIEPQVYGATLVKILGLVSRTSSAPLALGIVESKQQLKRRIQMIIAAPPSSFARTALASVLLTGVTGLSLTRETQAQPPVATAGPMVTTTTPTGWVSGGTGGREKSGDYFLVGVDRLQTHAGQPSAYLKSVRPDFKGYHTLSQFIFAENYLGKRVRFSGWIKTENAAGGGAGLWMRMDTKDTTEQFDNMGNRGITGTTGWQHYSVVLDVPANGWTINYGFMVRGTGQAWVSGLKFEVVGTQVPSTNTVEAPEQLKSPPRMPPLPKAPVNLGFRE